VVATKVLSPGQAVLLAAATNLVGALWGTAVAKTISSGLIDSGVVAVTPQVLICALLGATIWDLITWWWGLPSSSSHALVGGLCGAALAAASNNWSALIWWQGGVHWWEGKGLLPKVVLPMISSPLLGFIIGYLLMGALFAIISFMGSRGGLMQRLARPRVVNGFFGKAQIVSASAMGLSHGTNDAQKTMGIIALALATATAAGSLDGVARVAQFPAHRRGRGQAVRDRNVDQGHVRDRDGARHRRRRLAHHQDAGSQDGQAAPDQRFRGGDDLGRGDLDGVALRHPGIDDAQRIGRDHGRRRRQAPERD
jgi:phosphate/sulfate permease